jgi:hypothetical protein
MAGGVAMSEEGSHDSRIPGLLKAKDSTMKRSFSRDHPFKQLKINNL